MDSLSTSTFAPDLAGIPVGATLARSYWAVPGHYGYGDEFDTEIEALEFAVVKREHEIAAGRIDTSLGDLHITIDLRWSMTWTPNPAAGVHSAGSDFVAGRDIYKNLDDAKTALERKKRVSKISHIHDVVIARRAEEN